MIESPIITLDVDWAPDFILEEISEFFIKKKIKTTWFVTHESTIIEKLRKNSLFEIGIHPNFKENSTQGENPGKILMNLKNIVPEAKSIRTHSLIQSSQLLNSFHKFGIENDVSLFLENTSNIQPHYSKYLKLFRFPFFWEDDITMFYGFSKDHIEEIIKKPGMKIFNFHPIHIYLNSKTIKNYKEAIKNKKMQEIKKLDLEQYINLKYGTRDFLEDLINKLDNQSYKIKELKNYFES
jgi:hypothetical protein